MVNFSTTEDYTGMLLVIAQTPFDSAGNLMGYEFGLRLSGVGLTRADQFTNHTLRITLLAAKNSDGSKTKPTALSP